MPAWVLSAVAWLLAVVGLLVVVALLVSGGLWLVERILHRLGLWRDVTRAVIAAWEQRRKDTEALIVALLRERGELSSAAIRAALGLGMDAYRMLRDMEGRGRLVSRESEPVPERGGRPRILYRLPGATP